MISFKVGAKANTPKKKAQTLAEFSDPTADHPAALDTLSEEQREDQSRTLQVGTSLPHRLSKITPEIGST